MTRVKFEASSSAREGEIARAAAKSTEAKIPAVLTLLTAAALRVFMSAHCRTAGQAQTELDSL